MVEPDTVLATTYSQALKKAGLDVVIFQDAQSAIHGIDNHSPDIVVLELQLGDHNGVEFLNELRSHTDWQDIPVIVHTLIPRHDLGLGKDMIKQLGIDRILYKPQASLDKLIESITEVAGE